jgi:hypothetical protein
MRLTSLFPRKKYSDQNIQRLRDYCELIDIVDDHNSIVFADEKPMIEAESFGRVRRDILSGYVPPNVYDGVNVRHRYNIFAAVTTKQHVQRNVEAVVLLDIIGDSTVFQMFVLHLLQTGFLGAGDLLIVDNCTIHTQGANQFIVETLWNECGVLMIMLPAYTPELNPTELAFNAMDAKIKACRSRSAIMPGEDFAAIIKTVFNSMTRTEVQGFYRHCKYSV